MARRKYQNSDRLLAMLHEVFLKEVPPRNPEEDKISWSHLDNLSSAVSITQLQKLFRRRHGYSWLSVAQKLERENPTDGHPYSNLASFVNRRSRLFHVEKDPEDGTMLVRMSIQEW